MSKSSPVYHPPSPATPPSAHHFLLFHASPLPCFILEVETLTIVAANEAAGTLLHRNHTNLEGAGFSALFVPADRVRLEAAAASMDHSAWNATVQIRSTTVQGGSVRLWAARVRLEGKDYVQVTAVDVTEQKTTEAKLSLLATLVEETVDVLTAADANFRPLSWTRAAEKIYGLKAEEVIGKDIRAQIDITYEGFTREEVRAAITATGQWKGEMHFVRPTDYKQVTLITTFKVLRDKNGVITGHVIAGTDITERKEAEHKLGESERRFRHMADAAPVMIWMSDGAGRIVYVNRPMADYTGLEPDAYEKVTWAALVHPDDIAVNLEAFNDSFARQQPVTLRYRLKRAGGEYRWMQDSSVPRVLEDGSFLGYIGSITDIHDTSSKKEELRYAATVLENVQDVLVTTGLDRVVKSWNKIAEEVYGHTAEAAIGKRFTDLVHLEYSDASHESVGAALLANGTWKGEVMCRDLQGVERYFVHTVTFITDAANNRIGIMAVSRDVTERVTAVRNLRRSELFYRSLIADAHDGILLADASGTIGFASPAIERILGYQPEEVVGRRLFDFVADESRQTAMCLFQKGVSEQAEVASFTLRLKKKNGSFLWCSLRGFNMLHNPHVAGMLIYFHDDTLRKTTHAALIASEQHFRKLITDLHTGVLLLDAAGRIIMANNVMCNMLNVPEHALLQHFFWDLYEDVIMENGAPFAAGERPVLRAVTTQKLVSGVVIGILQPGTNVRLWLMVNADPVTDAEGTVLNIVCSFTDMTERKSLEQQLLKTEISRQKQLTQATIDGQEKERREIGKELHDNIGQQLTTTKLYLDMARSATDGSADEMLAMALKNVTDVINEIRGISRSLVPQTLKDLGLIDSVYDLVETVTLIHPVCIEVRDQRFIEDKVPENQKLMLFRIIQEQMNNIVKHAGATSVTITLENAGPLLLLQVEDDGCGFDTSVARKTLGLTNIRNRAELFGGTVVIISGPGRGCCLQVTIPDEVDELPF